MSEVDLKQALDVAIKAAKKGAEVALEFYKEVDPANAGSTLDIKTKTSPRDYVTEADFAVQKVIIEIIQQTYPDHRFIAEEKGADALGEPDSPYAWIIDPIDGTIPFIHGKDNWGTIIGLEVNGRVDIGVMLIPLHSELYTCIRGEGAFLNNKPIQLRKTRAMNDAVLCSNMIRRTKEIDDMLMISTPPCANLENYGSACDEFAEVLKGHNDGCFFDGVRYWDISAGCLMMEEAGGKSYYEFKEPDNFRCGLLVATSTEPIFEELKKFVFEKM